MMKKKEIEKGKRTPCRGEKKGTGQSPLMRMRYFLIWMIIREHWQSKV